MIIGTSTLVWLLVVGLPLGLLVAAEVYGDVTGCGSVDPTDPSNYSDVILLNDTSETVIIDDCAGAYCLVYDLPARHKPGQSHHDHAACGAAGKNMTSWRVKAADGRLLGYIAVDTPRAQNGLAFLLSKASRDRTTATPHGD